MGAPIIARQLKNRGLGNPSKTVKGGGYLPIPLSFFGQNDFLLRGGEGGYPPIPIRKKSAKNATLSPFGTFVRKNLRRFSVSAKAPLISIKINLKYTLITRSIANVDRKRSVNISEEQEITYSRKYNVSTKGITDVERKRRQASNKLSTTIHFFAWLIEVRVTHQLFLG